MPIHPSTRLIHLIVLIVYPSNCTLHAYARRNKIADTRRTRIEVKSEEWKVKSEKWWVTLNLIKILHKHKKKICVRFCEDFCSQNPVPFVQNVAVYQKIVAGFAQNPPRFNWIHFSLFTSIWVRRVSATSFLRVRAWEGHCFPTRLMSTATSAMSIFSSSFT